jgi:hypothetical protein
MTTDQEREAARNFLRESDGDLGVAISRLLTRVAALEARLAAHVTAKFDRAFQALWRSPRHRSRRGRPS